MEPRTLSVSSPGRICLFGEHQDYFGLAIIAAAVDLRMTIAGRPREDDRIIIDMPDMGEREELTAAAEMPYDKPRDYLKSAVNIHRRAGLRLHGWDCRITSTIPINAGTSSSSAMVVAWNKFLLEAAGDPRAADARALAELGFETEVAEFREPGGKMDHYASAYRRCRLDSLRRADGLRPAAQPLGRLRPGQLPAEEGHHRHPGLHQEPCPGRRRPGGREACPDSASSRP